MVFPVVMYGCESWTIRKAECWGNWCFWTVVLEKTLESPLDCKEIQPVHPKGDQSWMFFGRTDDVETETPIFWPPDAKSRLIWKDPDSGKAWRQEEKGTTEDEMVGWHHPLNGHVAAAAKLLQLCPTLCNPTDGSPPRSSVPGILQARILEWVAISLFNACMHAKSLQSCLTLCYPMTAAHQAPLSMGFSRQEYWSGLPFRSLPWTWVWVNSGHWWWTGRPGVLQSMGLPGVGHYWVTELKSSFHIWI